MGSNLKKISNALLQLEENDALKVIGRPDDKKLKSSMTLFNFVDGNDDSVFQKVLDKFFNAELDNKTLELLKE